MSTLIARCSASQVPSCSPKALGSRPLSMAKVKMKRCRDAQGADQNDANLKVGARSVKQLGPNTQLVVVSSAKSSQRR
jgi:hypothetical protein